MKKLLLTLTILFAFCCNSYAQTPINFLYIHGSDQGSVEEFQVWIDRMHPDMKRNLSGNELFQERILKDTYIKDEPEMLYWANRTANSRALVTKGLDISAKMSSFISNFVRSTIAYLLHDAIWLQKYSNMKPILDDLNKKVIANAQKGEKTVLVGYSAGTLITYQYLLNKTKFLDAVPFMKKHQKELKISDEYIAYIQKYANEPTCIDAIVDSGVGFMNADGGLMLNPNEEQKRRNIKKIKAQTKLSCAPDNAVVGVLNFGSPVVVFYSDIADSHSQLQYFTKKMEQNIIESGQFFMTVNYKKDPIAVPIDNIYFKQIQSKYPEIKNGGGFVYHTLVSGGMNVAASHLKYWDQTNHYTKAVAKSYENGYKLFYGLTE